MTPEDRIKQLRSDATPTEAEWLEFRSEAHRSLARRRIAAVAGGLGLVVALVVGGYAMTNMDTGDERGPGIAGTPMPSVTDDTDDPTPTASPSSDAQPEQLVQLWYVKKDGTLLLTHWPIEGSDSPERAAVETLVSFIPAPLGETGATTAIPDGTTLVDLSFDNGTANVTLRGRFPSDDEKRMAYAQIVFTVTQFETIKDAVISWGTESGTVAGRSLSRSDFHDLLPPIVVESPYPDQTVGQTFTLAGIANVYEGTVTWRLVGKAKRYEKEGFTTATCGSGCWGTFSTEITYEGSEDQVTLQVFQSSAEDGSPMDMIEIPVFFEES